MKKLLIISTLTFSILGCSNEPEIVLPDVKQVDIKNDQEIIDRAISKNSLYTTNFTEPLSYQDSAFLKLPKFP